MLPNLKKLINEFTEIGLKIAELEKEYGFRVSDKTTILYSATFKALVEERAKQNTIN